MVRYLGYHPSKRIQAHGARAVFQFYPENPDQVFDKAGGGVLIVFF